MLSQEVTAEIQLCWMGQFLVLSTNMSWHCRKLSVVPGNWKTFWKYLTINMKLFHHFKTILTSMQWTPREGPLLELPFFGLIKKFGLNIYILQLGRPSLDLAYKIFSRDVILILNNLLWNWSCCSLRVRNKLAREATVWKWSLGVFFYWKILHQDRKFFPYRVNSFSESNRHKLPQL